MTWQIPDKNYKTNGNEHMGPTRGSMDPPWDILGRFLVRLGASWGASQIA